VISSLVMAALSCCYSLTIRERFTKLDRGNHSDVPAHQPDDQAHWKL